MMGKHEDLVNQSYEFGRKILEQRRLKVRKGKGQFLTPPAIARYMAQKLGTLPETTRLLDPGAGTAILACAAIERAVREGWPKRIVVDVYEIDAELCAASQKALATAKEIAESSGIDVQVQVKEQDFVLAQMAKAKPTLFSEKQRLVQYDAVIANPPYFKLRQDDPRARAAAGILNGHTNMYTLFMALASELFTEQGRACFIVPRSFCSGTYFAKFRHDLLHKIIPLHVHLFESREKAFSVDSILQENLIFAFRKRNADEEPDSLTLSASKGIVDLHNGKFDRRVSFHHFLRTVNDTPYFRLPTSDLDEQIITIIDSWPGSLADYGLEISTGPIVSFRARSFLAEENAVHKKEAVPLYWLQNVTPHRVVWPALNANKPQAFATTSEADALLVPATNYVLMRRFSAKEEPRRLTAAPFLQRDYDYERLGIENHLNYIYRPGGELTADEARGLSALLGSALIDRYFRITNGNTQVNATELRALPLPSLDVIRQIGQQVPDKADSGELLKINRVVYDTLRANDCLPETLPLITETRITMNKIQEAQDLLQTLGLPEKQQNEISALTLLVLAQLSEETPWQEARRTSLRIHDMLNGMRKRYDRDYAENTRETVRRRVIHQFEQAGIVVRNPDDPTLPTDSPLTHYALSDVALRTIRKYETNDWAEAAQDFLETQVALIERYKRERELHRIPLELPTGETFSLSPGAHNELQAQIINEFGPLFAPGVRCFT